jgi:phosphoribosylformimino-5-aminoimidazole carboxamide ribotide isomerase
MNMEDGEGRMKSRDWTVYPAIDLRRGRVVRLKQGDPGQETKYADDPLHVARRWQACGAEWLHVVNLDGAFDERGRQNQAALARTLTTGLRVQFGGGIRDLKALRQALDLGVSRVVIGTAAVENPALVEAALRAFGPERIALGIDAHQGQVRTHGWQQTTSTTAVALAQRWATHGVKWIIFTDVARDGMGSGVNLESTVHLAHTTGLHVIASGGVASLEDVRRTYEARLSGVIIGRALYEGQVKLEDALNIM